MRTTNYLIIVVFMLYVNTFVSYAQLPPEVQSWELVWSDEFDYPNNQLESNWVSQNGPNNHILSSRYRDNAVVRNGILELLYKKENRGGQNWTAGNIWTKEEFRYGYFECKYKYAAASGTNNSFWIMNTRFDGNIVPPGRGFELDINEGHFPSEVNTNVHKFDRGFANRSTDSRSYVFGITPDVNLPLEIPITTKKIRFSSNNNTVVNIRELRVYNDNNRNFPNVLSETADTDILGLVNHARANGTKISVSGTLDNSFGRRKENMVDGKALLHAWTSQRDGKKWVELEWNENKRVGCVQFINGWNAPNWKGVVTDYKVEYWNGSSWVEIASAGATATNNLATEYHTYGFKWDENEFVWYFDGEEIRRTPNTHAYGFAPIWLSGAVIAWDGPVTNAIDGTSMKVEYVRVYKERPGGSNESLTKIEGPSVISPTQTITTTVDFVASGSRDIRVNFKDKTGKLLGHQIKTVSGTGSQTFTIPVSNLPVDTGYVLQAYMSPVGGNWFNRIGNPIEKKGISVTASVDALNSIAGPDAISSTQTITATVNYSAIGSRDIRVNFKDNTAKLIGYQIKTVTGEGTETFTIPVSNLPAGTGYVLQAYISPVGGNWLNRIGNPIEKKGISVTASVDALNSIAGPDAISSTQTITATVNYSAIGSRDIRVNFKDNTAKLIGYQIKTVTGEGTETFTIPVSNLPAGTGYVLQAYMSPVGGNWLNRIGSPIEKKGISVVNINQLSSINGPSSVARSQTINATVNYSAIGSKDIRVNFKSTAGQLIGHQIKTVSGTGNQSFSIPVTNLPTNINYVLQAYMSPVGGNWLNRVGNVIDKKGITVVQSRVVSNTEKSLVKDGKVEVYPVPFTDKLMINSKQSLKGASIKLFDINRKEVYATSISEQTSLINLSMDKIPSGIYFIHINNNNKVEVQQIIKK